MLFFWAFLDFQIFWVFWGLRAFQLFEPLLALIVWNFQTFLESFYQKYFRGNWNYLAWKIWIPIRARCLKITEKVLFNIASEAACYAYILNGQKLSNKKRQKSPFGRVFENLKLAVIQCYQTGQFYKDKNWWKMSKFKNSNATFWEVFKQCAKVNYGFSFNFAFDFFMPNTLYTFFYLLISGKRAAIRNIWKEIKPIWRGKRVQQFINPFITSAFCLKHL